MRTVIKLRHRKKLAVILMLSVIGLWILYPRRSTLISVKAERDSDRTVEMVHRSSKDDVTERFHGDKQSKFTNVTKILILTYMRSGSSFVAESLQQGYNDTFYSFEPFWEIYKKGYITPERVCHRDNRCSMFTNELQPPEVAISILKDIFECKLDSLPEEVLHSFSKFEQLADHRRLEKCFPVLKKHRYGKIKQKTVDRMSKTRSKCTAYLERKCRLSKQRVVKSIRISLQLTKAILEKIKHLKVIHLIRDPRAILQSRRSIGEFMQESFIPNVKQLCHRMSRDIDEVRALQDVYPGRIYPLRYECLAERPDTVLRKIYSDLSLPFNPKTEDWINSYAKGITHSVMNHTNNINDVTENLSTTTNSNTDKVEHNLTISEEITSNGIRTGYNVFKTNSTVISGGWRLKIPYNDVILIDKLCSETYERIGVRSFKSQLELMDLSYSDRYNKSYTDRYCS
ncbi:carbohydrate sulfotransferase 5-like [Mizuhopecten yessoensis]|uniref:Carbohydrate sulfotransferase 5 n=1 Tax=Mizuhopecten yessoensis TaxID=6573 RepID=A0A210QY05_MIZYE|nr:carbohydrate sulfotransferase 5-like [Mizuhopecten yessoensis]OWF53613.1 Carbohydrate sulfotransferase 5 [Mizuhopecten yessoensis]